MVSCIFASVQVFRTSKVGIWVTLNMLSATEECRELSEKCRGFQIVWRVVNLCIDTCRWWRLSVKVAGSLHLDRSRRASLSWSTPVTLLTSALPSNERTATQRISTSAATCTTSSTETRTTGTAVHSRLLTSDIELGKLLDPMGSNMVHLPGLQI